MSIELIGLILGGVVMLGVTGAGILLYFHMQKPPAWELPEFKAPDACPSCSYKEKAHSK